MEISTNSATVNNPMIEYNIVSEIFPIEERFKNVILWKSRSRSSEGHI